MPAEKRAERTCGEEKMATPGWTEKKRSSAPLRRGKVPQKIYWEGTNLNKISKKIVSLVTMAAFATTLVPAAAFAAAGDAKVNVTAPTVTDVVLNADGEASVNYSVATESDFTATFSNGQLAFWAGSAEEAVAGVEFTNTDTSADLTEYPGAEIWNNVSWIPSAIDDTTYKVTATFDKAGKYPLYVGAFSSGNTGLKSDVTSKAVAEVNVYAVAPSETNSNLYIDGNKTSAEVTVGDSKTVEFDLNQATTGAKADAPLNPNGQYVYLWAQNVNTGKLESAVTFEGATGDDVAATKVGNYLWKISDKVFDGDTITAKFTNAGNYRIYAGVSAQVNPNQNSDTIGEAFNGSALNILSNGYVTADISPATVVTADIMVDSVTGATRTASSADTNNNRTEEFTVNDNVTPSNTKVYTVKGTAYVDAEQTIEAANEVLEVSADNGLNLGGLTDGTVTTNARGEFEFTFTMEDAASYDITITESNDDAKTVLTIIQDDVDAVDIAVAKDGGYVLAGTDRTYASQVYGDGSALLSDAVQFDITDAYGRDAYGPGPIKDEAAANTTNHADSVSIVGQPDDADLTANNFYLAWDDEAGVYTLEYRGAAKDLTAGEYQVRVALNNGGRQAVTVSFTAAEFGDVQEVVLDTTAHAGQSWEANDNAITAIDSQVALGQWVNVVPKYVDANGLKVEADIADLQVGVNGDAVVDRHITKDTIAFRVANNTAANNAYVGSTITVRVNDPSLGAIGYVEKELTVVKNYQAETVSIDPTQGVVGEPNTVNVTVVAGEEISKVNGKLSATIVGQSDETADVNVRVNPDVKNGKASLYLESDKAGTADVRVVVTADNGELYADTFTYTFGDEDPYAGSYVVMTIGSDQYLINGEIFDGSADNLGAPYIDSAWRTMVPIRVLAESFGAEVNFDEEAQTVTIVDGDTTVVMTVGSQDFTINGEAAEAMDTAPVIQDSRTYVPVRFVAEALGYDVNPLYDGNGLTASVHFSK